MTTMVTVTSDMWETLRIDAARYRWLRSRLLAADFDYGGEGVMVLVFEMPNGFAASADCDSTVDNAMNMTGD
jgi:hypothetical protein